MSKKIIILGGGYAGVLTAKSLAKKVKKNKLQDQIEITLIDKNPYHTMLTELHEVACDRVEEDSIKMDLRKIFQGRNVNVVTDNIITMDLDNNKLISENQTYDYDYLVIGTGSKPVFFGTEGAEEFGFELWSLEDAIVLKEHFLNQFRLAEKTTDKDKRATLLNFAVVGGGFTGVELAGELAEWVPILCESYHINRDEVKITLVDMMPRILNSVPENVSEKGAKRLKKMGVEIKTSTKVVKVTKDTLTVSSNDIQTDISTNTVVWAAGIGGSEIVVDSKIGNEASRGNRVQTTDKLKYVDKDNVYVVGDNMFFIPEGEERSVPQMVENAEASSKACATNLFAEMTGKGEQVAYKPKFHGSMVCIGGRYGVAYLGLPNKMWSFPSFLAMFAKHFINIIYFIQVLGWNKVWHYSKQEFFGVKNNRSFVGGHFSNHSPTFWSVPLRLFLGLMWFTEGIIKLEKVILNPKNIFLLQMPESALVDGVTSASVEVANSFVPGIFHTIESYALTGLSLPIPSFMVGFTEWSLNTFIVPVAPYFQMFMVVSEVVIGLCLLGGLFTSMISLYSVALCFMIYFSGSANKEILFFLTGGLALCSIGGTGMTFSLDYYLMPHIKKWWKQIPLVRKWYIYND